MAAIIGKNARISVMTEYGWQEFGIIEESTERTADGFTLFLTVLPLPRILTAWELYRMRLFRRALFVSMN